VRFAVLGILRVIAENQPKCLSMNYLQLKIVRYPSRSIKANQTKSRYFLCSIPLKIINPPIPSIYHLSFIIWGNQA